MKFVLAFLLVLGTISESQAQVIKYKAYEYLVVKNDNTEASKKNWLKTDLLVVFNVDDDIIKVYGEEEHSFSFIGRLDCKVADDNNFCVKYDAIDDNGVKMSVEIIVSKTKNAEGKTIGMLLLTYKNGTTMYMMKTQ